MNFASTDGCSKQPARKWPMVYAITKNALILEPTINTPEFDNLTDIMLCLQLIKPQPYEKKKRSIMLN
jgi:hypothetical protein